MEARAAVVTRCLSKSYFVPVRKSGFLGALRTLVSQEKREVPALVDLSLEIGAGEFVGYIGPNGAGKSTTVKILTGILHPTSGEVLVDGLDPRRERQTLAYRIGVVFGQRTQLWWDLPAIDSFEILAAMYEVEPARYRRFLKEFDDLLGIGKFLNTPVRRLSLGQRMRAELAAALIHQPSILFLDEPTIGLDVMAKDSMRQFLRDLNARHGVTVLLTTHDLRDVEELCQRVVVINHGRSIYDGSLSSLKDSVNLPTRLKVKYARLPPGLDARQDTGRGEEEFAAFARRGWTVVGVEADSGVVEIEFDRKVSPVPAVLAGMQALGEMKDITIEEPSIEDLVKRILEEPAVRLGDEC